MLREAQASSYLWNERSGDARDGCGVCLFCHWNESWESHLLESVSVNADHSERVLLAGATIRCTSNFWCVELMVSQKLLSSNMVNHIQSDGGNEGGGDSMHKMYSNVKSVV
jgi:hypothetical protein